MEKIISTFRIVINRFSFPCNFQKIRRIRSKFLSIILNLIFENFINKKKKKEVLNSQRQKINWIRWISMEIGRSAKKRGTR